MATEAPQAPEKKVHTTKTGKKLVTLIPGDGIGPECVNAARRVIEATGAPIEWEERHAGASIFKKGLPSGVPPETIESLSKTRVALKGPLETPVGFGEKSANVTLRKLFETFANIRPVREMPGVRTPYSGRNIDLVIVRENVEDLYAGVEYMETPGVATALKLISRKGCDKIVRLAFEFARSAGRKKVHCATKSNIMKFSEGMLKRSFEAIAKEYPDIESTHIIVDNCAHQLVKMPEQFDVIVMTNMNGDILSDLSSALVGGLGFAPSANLGNDIAIFEAVHGSAPKYAGKNVINPSAVILSSVMMLRHLGEFDAASRIENAMMVTLEQGVLTRDINKTDGAASTSTYTDALIKNLGRKSDKWRVRDYKPLLMPNLPLAPDYVKAKNRRVIGVDIFIESGLSPQKLGESLQRLASGSVFSLKLISNRGTKVFPSTGTITDCIDQYRCRFMFRLDDGEATEKQITDLVTHVGSEHRWVTIEKLQEFDGIPTFTKSQGED